MTTVVYKSGVMAADTRITLGGHVVSDAKQKIFKLPDGSVVGVAGGAAQFETFLEDISQMTNPIQYQNDELDSLEAILVKNGSVFAFEGASGRFIELGEVEVAAIGSGGDFAIGAMAAGASPAEAVEIAARYDAMTGGSVCVIEVEK